MITEERMKEIVEHNREMLIEIQQELASDNQSIPEDRIIQISLANGLIDYLRDIHHCREYGPFE
jgi:hypothetical protein